MVDCSGGVFRMSILYSSSAISIIISKMIAFLSATKACRSKMTSVSLEVLLSQAPLSSVLVTLT
jgi:hypothetical protein